MEGDVAKLLTKVFFEEGIKITSTDQKNIDKLLEEIEQVVSRAIKKLNKDEIYVCVLIGFDIGEEKITYELNGFADVQNEDIDKYMAFKAILSNYMERLNEKVKTSESLFFDVHVVISLSPNIEEMIKNSLRKRGKKYSKFSEEETNYFVPVEPLYTLDKLILKEETKQEILKTVCLLEKRHILYDEWGFKEVEPNPKVILNFYGPPGTGKTMAAHAIAKYLNMKILALNYADIESKYVGEAPKNLIKAFKTAEETNALLFFDEADSFLGKRITSVSSSADQSVNSLRSQMLILLENFNGIVIFATNLIKNYDRAFETRIFKHIKFELPDKELRKKLIRIMIPSKVPLKKPLEDSELELLADISEGFSGRDIKNAVRDALISAIHSGQEIINFETFESSFKNYAENKKRLSEDINGEPLSMELKKKVEEKIKKNLEKENSEENASDKSIGG
jgi:SpoVK/Ycf46/Vps4 family AAA+-type ATPase